MQSHDLSLPVWGPYTKRYSGISHVPAANDGVRFDLSVFRECTAAGSMCPMYGLKAAFTPGLRLRI